MVSAVGPTTPSTTTTRDDTPVGKQDQEAKHAQSGANADADSAETLKAGALIAGSLTPGVGEAIDLYTLFHPDSTGTDRALSATSLAVNILTLGAAPNFGASGKIARLAKGDDAAKAAGDLVLKHEPGRPGAWNKSLQPRKQRADESIHDFHPFTPNATYEVGEFRYHTNRHGLVDQVTGTLQRDAGFRNGYQQRNAGGEARWPDDDGGHVIGTYFGGPGEGINLFAQNSAINRAGGDYRKLEEQWAEIMAADPDAVITVDIKLLSGNRERPYRLHVDAWKNGEPLHSQPVNNFDQVLSR